MLPPPSAGDAWIDFEGYPLVEDGLHYLFGATTADRGQVEVSGRGGLTIARKRRRRSRTSSTSFTRAGRRDPSMHLYHYAAYEVTALRKLMGLHGTREDEVDDLLRAEVFVDLLPVVRQGVRIGTPSYSLKDIERLYRKARAGEVATAGESISPTTGTRRRRTRSSSTASGLQQGRLRLDALARRVAASAPDRGRHRVERADPA